MLKSNWLSLPRPQNIDKIPQYNQCLLPSGGALTTYSRNIQREKAGHSRPREGPSASPERGICGNPMAPAISPKARVQEEIPKRRRNRPVWVLTIDIYFLNGETLRE